MATSDDVRAVLKSLMALRLEAPKSVCDDVAAKVERVLAALADAERRIEQIQDHGKVDPIRFLGLLADVFVRMEPRAFAERFFSGRHPSYLKEWEVAFNRGFIATWNKMDDDNRARFAAFLLEEGRTRFGTNVKAAIQRWADAERERDELAAKLAAVVEAVTSLLRDYFYDDSDSDVHDDPTAIQPYKFESLRDSIADLPAAARRLLEERDALRTENEALREDRDDLAISNLRAAIDAAGEQEK